MNITARMQQHQQTDTDEELAIDAAFEALRDQSAPYTVRQHIEAMEGAGASFGFERGVFCQFDNDGDPATLQALRNKACNTGISNDDVKAFFIAASRPGPSPVKQRKRMLDIDAFREGLRDLDAKDLVEVFDGLLAAANAMQGVLNRPRCQERAGHQLERLLDDLCAAYSAIVSEVEGRDVSYENALPFFHICAGYEIHCEGEPLDMARIAVKFAEAVQR